ncbi:MAG: metallophosphoesterase, partial [Defluviitaleaceae bacterium]|nr:metallophosphoesterase [Defluviitaleaceae bacterium]
MLRAFYPVRRVLASVLALNMIVATMVVAQPVSASEPAASPVAAAEVRGSNYRNLSLNPGANNREMRFTWHSGSPTGSIVIGPAVFHEVTFDAAGGTVLPGIQRMDASSEQNRLLVSENPVRVEAHHGVGAMGVTTNMQPTRPGFVYYLHQVSVYDLDPETEYMYRVLWDGGQSAPKSFTTGGGDSFRFLIAGDPQIGTGDGLDPTGTAEATVDGREWTSAIDIAHAAYPDAGFVLAVGDQVHSSNLPAGASANHVAISQYRHDRMFSPQRLHSLPMMAVVGNHDGWSFDDNNANPRLWPMHYNIPAPAAVGQVGGYNQNVFRHRGQFYTQFDYWVRWGNTFFFVLDANGANAGAERVMSGARLQFLEDALAQNRDAEWLVATFHHPAFDVYRVSDAPEKTQIINNFLPHFQRLNFDVILTGHAHVYNRTHHMLGAVPQLTQDWLDADGAIHRGEDSTNAVLDPEGIVHFTFNSASGSGFYNVSFMPRSYISAYNQNFRRNFSVAEVTPHTFAVRTYQINNDGSRTLVDVYTIVRSENGGVPAAALPLPQMDDAIFERITQLDVMTVDHSPVATAEGLGLPETVGIETNLMNNVGGNVANIRPPNGPAAPGSYGLVARTPRAPVIWDVQGSGYDPSYDGVQFLYITGTVEELPRGVSNPNNIPLQTTLRAVVLPYGTVPPGVIAEWMQVDGMETYFVGHGGIGARRPYVHPTFGADNVHHPLGFWVGDVQRMFQWNAGAPTVTQATVPGGTGAVGGLHNLNLATQPARWQTVISTRGRAGVQVQFDFRSDPAGTGVNNNGPRDWQMQYSLDGNSWTSFGMPVMLSGFWDAGIERTLPPEANDQDRVYIRWLKASTTAVGGGAIASTARNHMRNIIIRSTEPLLDVCLCWPGEECTCDQADAMRIDVLMFNDLHGHIEAEEPVPENPGAARLTAFIEHQRSLNPNPNNVILVGGGDEFHGYAVATLTGGSPVLTMMGYLAEQSPAQRDSGIHVAFGNHEFSFGYARAGEIGRHPNVTLLAADLFYGPNHPRSGQRPDFVRPYDVLEFPDHDITIALVGLMTSNMQSLISGWGTMGGGGLHFRSPAPGAPAAYTQYVADLIHRLRTEYGVGAVIGVTHNPGNSATMTYIANNLDFDALVGGHLHVLVNREVNGVPIIEAQMHGRRIGRFSLYFDDNNNLDRVEPWVSGVNEIMNFNRLMANATGTVEHYDAMTALMAPYLEYTYDELRGPRGPHGIYFADRNSRDVWSSRLVLDYVVRWAQARGESEHWIGISNGGGWRNTGFWPRDAGEDTTLAQLISTMPFNNNILLFQMHGQDVLSLVNATGLTGTQVRSGMHQSGGHWYVTSSGERILNDRTQTFNVVGSNFIFGGLGATGGDNYPWPGNVRGNQMGMIPLDVGGPRVVMADGSAVSWNYLLENISDSADDWEGLGVSMIRTALLESTDFRRVTTNELWQAELTVSAEGGGTAVITSPFAPGNRSRNMNIIPQWVTVTASELGFLGWFNEGDPDNATPLSTNPVYSFAIRANTNLEARFTPAPPPPASELPVAWASADLNASHGHPGITNAATFTPRWNAATGTVSSAPGTAGLSFMVDGVARTLAAGSGGINVIRDDGVDAAGSGLNGRANNAYWFTEVSTVDRTDIDVQWSMRSTNTGPRDWQLQYSIDGTDWNDVGDPIVIVNAGGTNPANINVASHLTRRLPDSAEGHTNLRIRWLMTSNTSVQGGTVPVGGTTQIGNILIDEAGPLYGTIAAWASADLFASNGIEYPAITGANSFNERWTAATGTLSSAPGTSGLRFMDNGVARTLAAGSQGINAGDGLNDRANNVYWLTEISTVRRANVQVAWTMRSTGTGPRYWQLQYSTNGTAWNNAGELAVITAAPTNVNTTGNVPAPRFVRSLPSTAEGHESLWLRWLMTSNTAVNNNPIASGGTHQIGNVHIFNAPVGGSAILSAEFVPVYMTVQEARLAEIGAEVTVRGIATAAYDGGFFLQDAHGASDLAGIVVRYGGAEAAGAVGHLVEVRGVRGFSGDTGADDITVSEEWHGLAVLTPAALPVPVSVQYLADLLARDAGARPYASMLVAVEEALRVEDGGQVLAGADASAAVNGLLPAEAADGMMVYVDSAVAHWSAESGLLQLRLTGGGAVRVIPAVSVEVLAVPFAPEGDYADLPPQGEEPAPEPDDADETPELEPDPDREPEDGQNDLPSADEPSADEPSTDESSADETTPEEPAEDQGEDENYTSYTEGTEGSEQAQGSGELAEMLQASRFVSLPLAHLADTAPESALMALASAPNGRAFVAAADEDVMVVRVLEGGSVGSAMPFAQRGGYIFEGWNTARDGSGTDFDGSTLVYAPVRVYALWSRVPTGQLPSEPGIQPAPEHEQGAAESDDSGPGESFAPVSGTNGQESVEVEIVVYGVSVDVTVTDGHVSINLNSDAQIEML